MENFKRFSEEKLDDKICFTALQKMEQPVIKVRS